MREALITDFLYGYHPVREALRHRPQTVLEVLIAATPGRRRSEIEALCQRHRLTVQRVSASQLNHLAASSQHNGFGAKCQPRTSVTGVGDPDLRILVEDVQDPRNLGALLRVCEGAGVAQVMIRDRGSAPLTPAVAKTAAGATEWLQITRITNSAQEIERAQAAGFWVYGADADGDAPWQVDLSGKVLLCFGGEEKGLRARTRKLCDGLLGLPMRGRVESLNLATAAAALLYEAVRQRLQPEVGNR